MDKEKKDRIFEEYKHRIIGLIIALILALITIFMSFGKALGFGIILWIGYLIGSYFDGKFTLDDINEFFDRRF